MEKNTYDLTKLPKDFKWHEYASLYDDLKYLRENSAKKHYLLFGKYEKRMYNYNCFNKLPKDFLWQEYVLIHNDLKHLNEYEAKTHYIKHGIYEKRNYKKNKINANLRKILFNDNTFNINNENIIANEDYILIHNDINITEEQITLLYEHYLLNNTLMLSPKVIKNGKLVYFGGLIDNMGKCIFINEEILQLTEIAKSSCFSYVQNTVLSYPKIYIINNKNNILHKNKADFIKNALELKDVKFDPFISVDDNGILNDYNANVNIMNININQIKNIYNVYKLFNFISMNFYEYKYLYVIKKKHILILESSILTPNQDCGSVYMYNIILCLIKLNFIIHYIPVSNFYNDVNYSYELQKMGIHVIYKYPFCLGQYLLNNGAVFDYVIISRFNEMNFSYDIVKKYCYNAKIIFNTHDLNYLRIKRSAMYKNVNTKQLIEIKNKELELCKKSDVTCVISQFELCKLKKKNINVNLVPLYYKIKEDYVRNNEKCNDIFFIGSTHEPNIDAIEFFIKNHWTNIHKKLNITLNIIGNCVNKIQNKYLNIKGIKYHGIVNENIIDEMLKKYKINVMPLRYGAGIKGKILQSINLKIPCITTQIGIEGLPLEHNKHVFVSTFNEKFCEEFIEIYNNNELLNKIAENAYKKCATEYTFEKCKNSLSVMFENLENIKHDNEKINNYNICIMIACYNNHDIINVIYNHYKNMGNIDIFLINNNIQIHDQIVNQYSSFVKVIMGENSSFEFSGFQKCINMLINKNEILKYDIFIFCTDALHNDPTNYLKFLNLNAIDYCAQNEVLIGNLDTFKQDFNINNNIIQYWCRTSLILINKNLLKKNNYIIMTYDHNEIYDKINNKFKISIDEKTLAILNEWVNQTKYDYLNNEKKKIKITCILNEYMLTYNLKKYGKIHDFFIINFINYAKYLKMHHYSLNWEKIPFNNNKYISADDYDNLLKLNVFEQLNFKKNNFYYI
jgi:hypothetical protein